MPQDTLRPFLESDMFKCFRILHLYLTHHYAQLNLDQCDDWFSRPPQPVHLRHTLIEPLVVVLVSDLAYRPVGFTHSTSQANFFSFSQQLNLCQLLTAPSAPNAANDSSQWCKLLNYQRLPSTNSSEGAWSRVVSLTIQKTLT